MQITTNVKLLGTIAGMIVAVALAWGDVTNGVEVLETTKADSERVTLLESDVDHVKDDVDEIKEDTKETLRLVRELYAKQGSN